MNNWRKALKALITCSIILLLLMTTSRGVEIKDEDEAINIEEELENIKNSQNELVDYSNIQQAIDQTVQNSYEFDFEKLVTNILSGQYELEGETIGSMIFEAFFEDMKANIGILIRIIIISIIAAFFKSFTQSFENKQVSEMGFLIVFLLVIASVIQSYHLLNSVANGLIDNLLIFIEALVPSLLTVTVLSGAATSSVMFSETMIMLIGIIDNLIKTFMLPFLYIIIIFVVLNTLTDEDSLSKIIDIFKKGYEWAIKIILWIFVAMFGLQSFGLPVVDGMISRTAKQTIGIVPIIGTTISGMSDIVLGCGSLIKNAFGIGAIIAIVFVAVIPVIKIGVIAFIYKLSAALIEPISESKLVSCLSNVGDVCFLLLGTVLIVVLLFIIAIAMTLFLTNIMLYIR
ncbi:MAG: hypothetical protein CVU84_03405 [Firmicutes bacterium HGW-Firmicutes-1]|jgi:stage III sporulation protein AE|nr:MAG: hypothetical protein CVU84_03405 [Firmicutes bacterium HGW-Firmicutes-1]